MAGRVDLTVVRAGSGPAARGQRVVRMLTPIATDLASARRGDYVSVPRRTAERLVERGQAAAPAAAGDGDPR